MPTVIGVSIAIPEPFGSELQRARISFGDTAAEGIPTHITLLPPTEVDDATLGGVRAHLERVAAAARPFVVQLRGTGTFRPVSPVVFVQIARGIPHCERLEQAVRQGLLERELAFPYHPHITVAQGVSEENLDRAFDELATYTVTFTVSKFYLYIQGEDGAWHPVESFTLGASHADPAGTA
ncbi:2'-5' RNA ligase family protein [Arsenicicoccus piscis]|uniref:Phosphoesterase n=1 Tax=Arsenicicoccus piscis TaxID=673954 RepID=A0ABQ6HQ14_9MICO|nr:2'-5' RNA ligase family protein [Arsenicicoccus piscis]MCH8629365.1 2'-5' RNA ligase family protein [Arsenicicoccus piscis]GMA20431.1 phosphoesterase [Arsenicicoccus piscis]